MRVLAGYLRGAGALTVQAVVQRLLGAATSIVLARGLGAEGLGAYSAVINTASSAYGMIRLGVDSAIHVSAARGQQGADAIQRTSQLLCAGLSVLAVAGLVGGGAVALSAELLAVAVFGQIDLTGPLRFAGALTALQCLSQFSYATLAGFQEFRLYARLMIVNAMLMLVLSLAGMWLYGLAGALGGYGVAQVVLAIALGRATVLGIRARGLRLTCTRLGRSVCSLMRLGIPVYLSGLLAIPVTFYLQGLLSRSAGVDALGIVRVIGTITAIVTFVPASIAAVTTSTLTRTRSDAGASDAKLYEYAFLHIKAIWYLTTIVAIMLLLVLPFIVTTLFGEEYEAAIEPGLIALFSAVLSSTAVAASSLFFAMERPMILFWQSALQSLAMGCVGLFLIPALSVLGYVTAELIGNLIGLAFVLVVALRMSSWHARDRRIEYAFGLFFVAGILSIVTVHILPEYWQRIAALVSIAVLVTAGLVRWGLSAWELSIVRRMSFG